MFECPKNGEKAILVHVDIGTKTDQDELAEFEELATSAGGSPVATVMSSRKEPDPRLYIGRGKAGEIRETILATGAGLVIFKSCALTQPGA